jgi:hypothetical protein
MLADFASRLASGLAGALLVLPWRHVPLAYFRTICLVILALSILAAVDAGFGGGGPGAVATLAVGAALAYLATVAWGLGLPRAGQLLLVGVVVLLFALQVIWADEAVLAPPRLLRSFRIVESFTRIVSALLLGTALAALLLGHHYLTAPSMSIVPLMRLIGTMGLFLFLRAALAAEPLILWRLSVGRSAFNRPDVPIYLAMRWALGLVLPSLGAWMAWQSARIRSTQSATGILYAAFTLLLLGELASMVLARITGVAF